MTPDDSAVSAEGTETRITLARLETKIDIVIGQHGATLADHERRLRAQEAQSFVTPKGLVAALVSTVAILGGSIAFLDRLYM